MTRCGFKAKGLFVMDGSRRGWHANAYFTGLGSSKRVVFLRHPAGPTHPEEVDAVLARVCTSTTNITRRMVTMSLMSLAGFALLGWLSSPSGFMWGWAHSPTFKAPTMRWRCCCSHW